MLFVNGNDFEPAQLSGELYGNAAIADLPNIICILDKGVVVSTQVNINESGEGFVAAVHTVPEMQASYQSTRWVFLPYGDKESRKGSNF